MTLRDAASQVTVKRAGNRCTVGKIYRRLDDDDRAWLREALANDNATGEWIAEVLTSEGYPVEGQTVSRHRRGGCKNCDMS